MVAGRPTERSPWSRRLCRFASWRLTGCIGCLWRGRLEVLRAQGLPMGSTVATLGGPLVASCSQVPRTRVCAVSSPSYAVSPVNFDDPPVVEVALSVQFAPIPGLSSYRSGTLYSKWASEYPNVTQQPELPPMPPLEGSEGLFIQLRVAPGARLWFEAAARDYLIQVQDDRLAVNWRRVGEVAYPRYVQVRERFTSAWGDLRALVGAGDSGVSQVEVSYVNLVPRAPDVVLAGWQNPVCSQANGRFTAQYEEEVRLGSSSRARRVTTLVGAYGERPETRLTLTVRAEPDDTSEPLSAIDAARAHIVGRFRKITDSAMHKEWGDLDEPDADGSG